MTGHVALPCEAYIAY